MAAGLDRRRALLDRPLDHVHEIDPLQSQLDGAPGDPRGVEQVLDQARHIAGLAVHHLERPLAHRFIAPSLPQDLDGVDDRGQGVSELVRQRGEELVLAAARLLERLLGAVLLAHVAQHREVETRQEMGPGSVIRNPRHAVRAQNAEDAALLPLDQEGVPGDLGLYGVGAGRERLDRLADDVLTPPAVEPAGGWVGLDQHPPGRRPPGWRRGRCRRWRRVCPRWRRAAPSRGRGRPPPRAAGPPA